MDDLTQDVIDTRDIQDRIVALSDDLALDPDNEDIHEEMLNLREFKAGFDAENWEDGATIIADNYFTEYAEEMAKDCGYINGDTEKWPFTHIDWDAAADELKTDYTEVTFNGETYWTRDY